MRTALLIALAGGIGSLARYGLGSAAYALFGSAFPWGTLAVNVLGCLAIGVVMQAAELGEVPEELRAVLAIGFLGGFTTYSAFSYETLSRIQDGQWGIALLNVIASVVLGLGAAWLGMTIARTVWSAA